MTGERLTEAQDTPTVRATLILIDAMTFAEREVVRDRIEAYGVMRLPNGSELTRFLSDLFVEGRELSTDQIFEAAQRAEIAGSTKQIYNALGYLTRKGTIKRMGYGVYVALASPAGRAVLAAQGGDA